jgi:hypothetical protein
MNIMEKGIIKVKKKVLVYKNGKIIVPSKEIFIRIKQKDGVFLIILKVIYIKGNLRMIRQMDMENIIMKMVEYIQDIGLMIYNLV